MKRLKIFLCSELGHIFLAAFLLRVILSPFFFHTDNKTNYYNSHFLSQGVINIYEYLAKNPDKSFLGEFSYPPLTYLFYGTLYYPLRIILGNGFLSWLSMGNEAVDVTGIFRFLFFTKLPLFIFEFGIGFILLKLFKDESQRKKTILFWFFNPINIYAVVMMGQFDIVPTFLLVFSLYLAVQKKKYYLAAICLGLGGALKTFPLLFLPFLVFIAERDIWRRIKLFFIGLIPYLLFVLPFLGSSYFRQSSFVSGLSQRMFLLNLSLGFGEQILLTILFLMMLLFYAEWKGSNINSLPLYFLLIPLIILSGSHFHPQWLLWASPFLAYYFAKKNIVFPLFFLIMGWIGVIIFFNDKFLTWGLISPFDRGIFFLPSIADSITPIISPLLLQSIFHTLFAASALWIAFKLIIPEKGREE